MSKRESLAITQAAFNARVVASNLGPQDSDIPDVLGSLRPPAGGASLVYREGRWYSTSLGTDPEGQQAFLAAPSLLHHEALILERHAERGADRIIIFDDEDLHAERHDVESARPGPYLRSRA